MKLTKNFSLVEFACRDGNSVPPELVDNVRRLAEQLQVLRDHIGKPIRVNSGYRTPSHNAKVKGAKSSRHLTAEAADIVVAGMSPTQVKAAIMYLIGKGAMRDGGIGTYATFLHYDIGKPRRW